MKNQTSKSKVAVDSATPKTGVRNLHVVPRNDGWAVRIEGQSRAISTHQSQRMAIEAARKITKQNSTQLVIHGRDGRIRDRVSNASDPLPPKQPRKVLYPSSSPNTNREAIRKAVSEAVREASEKQTLVSKAS